MLPSAARLRRREEFAAVLRTGRRVGAGGLVVHVLAPTGSAAAASSSGSAYDAGPVLAGPRFGLIVGRGVGNAVRRNEISRRLRHQLRPWLAVLPAGCSVVVRALPRAAGRASTDLAADLRTAFGRLGLAAPTAVAPPAVTTAGSAP